MAIEISTVAAIFSVPRTAKSIAEMLGIIESVDSKMDTLISKTDALMSMTGKLMQSKFEAAIRSLEQAKDTSSETEKPHLFREARQYFNEAIFLEKEDRLIAAHFGLAFCHFALGDSSNGLITLKSIEKIENSSMKCTAYILLEFGENFNSRDLFVTPVKGFKSLERVSMNLIFSFHRDKVMYYYKLIIDIRKLVALLQVQGIIRNELEHE